MINALDAINNLEQVAYDQTYKLVDPYKTDTPQSHQCGCIAQTVQQIEIIKACSNWRGKSVNMEKKQ